MNTDHNDQNIYVHHEEWNRKGVITPEYKIAVKHEGEKDPRVHKSLNALFQKEIKTTASTSYKKFYFKFRGNRYYYGDIVIPNKKIQGKKSLKVICDAIRDGELHDAQQPSVSIMDIQNNVPPPANVQNHIGLSEEQTDLDSVAEEESTEELSVEGPVFSAQVAQTLLETMLVTALKKDPEAIVKLMINHGLAADYKYLLNQ